MWLIQVLRAIECLKTIFNEKQRCLSRHSQPCSVFRSLCCTCACIIGYLQLFHPCFAPKKYLIAFTVDIFQGNIRQTLMSLFFIIELTTSFPFIVSVRYYIWIWRIFRKIHIYIYICIDFHPTMAYAVCARVSKLLDRKSRFSKCLGMQGNSLFVLGSI